MPAWILEKGCAVHKCLNFAVPRTPPTNLWKRISRFLLSPVSQVMTLVWGMGRNISTRLGAVAWPNTMAALGALRRPRSNKGQRYCGT